MIKSNIFRPGPTGLWAGYAFEKAFKKHFPGHYNQSWRKFKDFSDLSRNLGTFQGKMAFKDFSRTSPKIQGLFRTVRTLVVLRSAFRNLRSNFGFFCPDNHLRRPPRKHMLPWTSSKGHGLWFVIGGFRSLLFLIRFVACYRPVNADECTLALLVVDEKKKEKMQLSKDRKPRACQKLAGGPVVGKCPTPRLCKIC